MRRLRIILLSLVVLGVFTITLGQLLPFQFSSSGIASSYYALLAIVLPILISILFYQRTNNKLEKAFIRIWGTISIWLVSSFLLGVYWFTHTMCGYGANKIMFANKSNSSARIIERSYGCGAFDSDMPKYEYIKIIPITQLINYYQRIDTSKLDLTVWYRVDNY